MQEKNKKNIIFLDNHYTGMYIGSGKKGVWFMETNEIIVELKEFIDRSKNTQTVLAQESGISQAQISRIYSGEQNNPKRGTAEALSKALIKLKGVDMTEHNKTIDVLLERIKFLEAQVVEKDAKIDELWKKIIERRETFSEDHSDNAAEGGRLVNGQNGNVTKK